MKQRTRQARGNVGPGRELHKIAGSKAGLARVRRTTNE
jgi:hypothetical protein